MKKVLVTGAAGFVGKHMIRCLLSDEKVQVFAGVLNRQEATLLLQVFQGMLPAEQVVELDITNAEQVQTVIGSIRPQAIVHLAAQASVARSFSEPEQTMRMNVQGTRFILDAVVEAQIKPRVLLIGSADQYGNVPLERQPIKEAEPLRANSPYGQSKVLQEQLAKEYRKVYGVDCVVIRSAPHTGPGQSPAFVVPDWCRQIREMRDKTNRELLVGDVSVVRDLTDVRDVVGAYKALLDMEAPDRVYNVGTGRGICLQELPGVIAKCAGVTGVKVVVDEKKLRPAEIQSLIVDNSKLRAHTGWTTQYKIEDTIRDMLAESDFA